MSNIFTRLLLNTDGFNKNLYQAQKNLRGFAATSKGVFGGLTTFTGYAAAFVGISTSIHSAVTANMEFEKSLSSLRSLTGVSVQELNYFRAEAIKMAMDSTQSAVAMVDAYKLIGSQMPELLKNKEALSATARAAVTLAEAAEIDVPTAAKALTGSLNQMGESSSRASEYINILAAASQQGSADIPYLNKAIENSGGTASSVGIKFNELVAAIEAIAPKITDAASNGTNLRNIFLTLESAADNNLRPSVVGLSKALENLAAKNLDAVQLTKMFGKESVTAAIALLSERDAFESLRRGIEGTNTAYEQAEINNDNLAGSIGKLQSAWTSFINTMAASNGVLSGLVDTLKEAVEQATRLMMPEEERQKYDDNKKYKDGIKINQQEAVKRLNDRISKGVSVEDAIDAERQLANRMYPEALKYSVRLEAYERARAEAEKARQKELKYGANVAYKDVKLTREKLAEAEALYKVSEEEYVMRNAIYDVLKQQEQQLKKNKEEANKVNTTAGDSMYKSGWIAQSNINGWLMEKISDRGKFDSVPGSLPIVNIPISIDEDQVEEQLPQSALEIKLKAKLVNWEFANSKIRDLMSLMPVADLKEKEQLQEQINVYKEYAGIVTDKNNDVETSFIQISQAIGMMNNAFQGNADSIGQWAFSMIGNVSQMISQLQSLAMAQGVASAFKLPPPASFIAAATVISTVAGIFASIPKFANGGIIGGSSFYGDKLLARVNSGEMILNQNQQKSLYQMTSGENENNIASFKVRGSDIYMSLKNYLKQTGKRL